MKFFRSFLNISSLNLTLLSAIFIFYGLNFSLLLKLQQIWQQLPELSALFILTVPIFFITCFVILLTPFIVKSFAKPFLIFVFLTSALINYTSWSYGLYFDKDMIINFLETNTGEAASYFNFKAFLIVGLTGVLPSVYIAFANIIFEKPFIELRNKVITILICFALIGGIASIYYKDYASIARNNSKIQKNIVPLFTYISAGKLIKQKYFTKPLPYLALAESATRTVSGNQKTLMIVVVGETARAQNNQLNGYNRPTNPYTSQIENLFYFKNTVSCGTSTAVSMPCMLSLLGHENYSPEKFASQDHVINFLNKTNVKSVWIDNNTGSKSIASSISEISTSKDIDTKCAEEACTDDVMLPLVKREVQKFNGADGVVFVHIIGSHGPTYFKRYPKEKAFFQPECATSDLSACTREEIINSYDNSIRFTDFFIAELINYLKSQESQYNTALLYASDHGESLGDGGIYLHGMPYSVAPITQRRVPMMLWLSDNFITTQKIDKNCMKKKTEVENYSHANFPITILDAMGIKSEHIKPELSLLNTCSQT